LAATLSGVVSNTDGGMKHKFATGSYNILGLLLFFLFLDKLLRHVDGQGWGGVWPSSGRLEVMVLYLVLSLLAQLAYWSRIVSRLNQGHP
jgi:hypothetical protein